MEEQQTETVDLRVDRAVPTAHLGRAQLQRGYVYWCRATCEAAYHTNGDAASGVNVGYHGLDVPPCAADWLCDDHDSGYLVISTESDASAIGTAEHWELTEARSLEAGTVFDDGVWCLVIVRQHGVPGGEDSPSHEYTMAGSL